MSRWYRAYCDAYRNPKVASLTDREFRLWHRLLSIAAENDGVIPPVKDLKWLLISRSDHLLTGIDRLISNGLIDRSGEGYVPHNWSKRQWKSDTSTPRVQKHRAKLTVTVTPPDTDTDTDTDTELDKSSSPARAEAREGNSEFFNDDPPDGGIASSELHERYTATFESWWQRYPNKTGKGKAAQAYQLAFKRLGGAKAGVERVHRHLLRSLEAQVGLWKRKGVEGRFIPHAATWLSQSRWEDDAVQKEALRITHATCQPEPDQRAEALALLSPATPKPDPARRSAVHKRVGWTPDDE